MKALLFAASVSVALLTDPAFAQEKAGSAKAPEPYAPGLGDFMTAYVQPHHIKLWLAGHADNWPLAEYEADELKESFEDVTTYQGNWHELPIAKLIAANIDPALSAVDDAIKARSGPKFTTAFERMTVACNNCHKTTDHAFLVVKVPKASDFPDQEFAPPAASGK